MEGLFTVVFIIITIVGFIQKAQNREQGRGARPGNAQRQYPGRQYRQGTPMPQNKLRPSQGSSVKKPASVVQSGEPVSDAEGAELESRYRTGSMNYIEQDNSSEGMGYESAAAPVIDVNDESQQNFDISAEDLMRSVVMAEVLGRPRAMKRNIR